MIYKVYETFIFICMDNKTELKCSTCGKFKKVESFSKNNRNKSGRDSKCKICKNLYQKLGREKRGEVFTETLSYAKMSGLTKRDWCKTYEFLKSMGYDVTKDIHLQFTERHGLRYKQRPKRNKITYTYEDCLDCSD